MVKNVLTSFVYDLIHALLSNFIEYYVKQFGEAKIKLFWHIKI